MKKKTAITLGALALLAGGVTFGNIKNKDKKQEKATSVNNLQSENKNLLKQKKEYDARVSYHKESVRRFEKNHPQYDNMDSVFVLLEDIDSIVAKMYVQYEQDFMKKCAKSLKKFANNNGEYAINEDGGLDYFIPQNAEQWMGVVYEHYGEISNFDVLESEYNKLQQFDQEVSDFHNFVYGDFARYVDMKPKTKEAYKKQIRQLQQEFVMEGSKGVANEFIDAENTVYKKNNQDNITQDKLIAKLSEFLKRFVVSAEDGETVVYNELTCKVIDLISQIRTHNELEANIISYDSESKSIAKQIKANNSKIAKSNTK